MRLPCFLFNLNQSRVKAHGVQRISLEGFTILGSCMVKVHMNILKDIVWSRSLVQVFNLVQQLSVVWSRSLVQVFNLVQQLSVVWSRSIVQVFNLVQVLSVVWTSLVN